MRCRWTWPRGEGPGVGARFQGNKAGRESCKIETAPGEVFRQASPAPGEGAPPTDGGTAAVFPGRYRTGAVSSARQSTGLLIRVSWVRFPHGPLLDKVRNLPDLIFLET